MPIHLVTGSTPARRGEMRLIHRIEVDEKRTKGQAGGVRGGSENEKENGNGKASVERKDSISAFRQSTTKKMVRKGKKRRVERRGGRQTEREGRGGSSAGLIWFTESGRKEEGRKDWKEERGRGRSQSGRQEHLKLQRGVSREPSLSCSYSSLGL